MQNWIKKGLVYKTEGAQPWNQSHTQVPVADVMLEKNIVRVYFSTRDGGFRSRPSYVDLNSTNLLEVVNVNNEKPLLELGEIGTFDDCGVMPSWVLNHGDKKYMYYIGWNVRKTISYHNSVGLAISHDDGDTWEKFSTGPLWDRNYVEPHYSGTSCVLIDDDGIWKNWYLSCTEWRMINNHPEPRYHIKYAESKNGIDWERKGQVCIDYESDLEAGIVKASVIKENGTYKMWYSYRKFLDYRVDVRNSYRIGYAESSDGMKWQRMDNHVNLEVSEEGWDSKMIEYPHVFDLHGKRFMLYNGNGFGTSGFGLAELK